MPSSRPSDRIARAAGAVSAEVDGEVVALDVARGACFGFNGVASRIWRLIDPPAEFGAVRDALMREYQVDLETCERELAALLQDLEAQGLVTVRAGDAPRP